MESKERLEKKKNYIKSRRGDPLYQEYEKSYSKQYRMKPEVKKKRVKNQIRYERKLKYGLTDADYQKLLKDQDGKCAICFTDDSGERDWHVDHCHKTGKVRALLCFKCNVGLGSFRDDEVLLRRAADYIAKHSSQQKGNNI